MIGFKSLVSLIVPRRIFMQLEYIKCNLCGKDDYKVLYAAVPEEKQEVAREYSAGSSEILKDQVVKCKNCSFVYINPRPKSEDIVEGYSAAKDELYASQASGRIATFRSSIKKIEKFAPNKGKILDVGAACGFFLKAAKDSGWEVTGVEPSNWMTKWGNDHYGVNIKQGILEEAKFPDNSFDVITFMDVLEHVPDARASLIEAHRILKPGGILAVNYPNFGSNLAKIAGRKWWFLLSVHLWYFTPATIKRMLADTGFEQLNHTHHFQKLNFGYLAMRVKPYNKFLGNFLEKAFNASGLSEKQLMYYASQSLVIAKKK